MGENKEIRRKIEGQYREVGKEVEVMKATAKKLTESQQVLLVETVDWVGRFLSAYARLKEAERDSAEDAFDEAWGDLTSNLLILQEKAQQAHDLLDPEENND